MSDLERRVEELEGKLANYAEWMNDSIEQRDRLCLDAAWGIVESSAMNFGMWAPIVAANLKGWTEWWQIGLSVIVGASLGFFLHSRAHKMRMAEIDKLARLPDWDKISQY